VGLFLAPVLTQPPIPSKYSGHPRGSPDGQVLLEVFYDHLCPDSKASWPTMKQVLSYYGNKLDFYVHTFPLPYHRNAFYSTQAGLVVESAKGEDAWFQWLDLIFEHQDEFGTAATANITGTEVINQLAKYAAALGVDASTFSSGMQYGSIYDANARVDWKYATTRAIYGTPIFLVNGVFATDDSSWTFTQWKQLIDSLLNP